MKNVYLENFAYPCVAYVIERLGLSCSIKELFNIEGSPYSNSVELEVGDIVVWVRSDEFSEATLTMKECSPVSTKINLNKHFGVYEGNGLVSDITFDSNNFYPRIRLMPLTERQFPQRYIRLHTNKD